MSVAASPVDPVPRRRLLVVDDEETILFAMREYFSGCGYDVCCAREREEAEALLAHRQFDLVIADLRLSWLDPTAGLELVSFVRRRRPEAHIVVLTAFGSAEVEAEALARGVDAFLQKPLPLPEVARILEELQH